MAFTLEDGSGVDGSNAYVSESVFEAYCEDHGVTPASGDVQASSVRTSQWLDGTYRARFPGWRVKGRLQGMEFPRSAAYDASGNLIPDDEVPVEIINAVCEGMIRDLADPGSLAPDLERGGSIKQLQAGSVNIVYGDNASATTSFLAIEGIMSGIIGSSVNSFTASAVRG